jgi:uncharacterized protein
MNWSLLSHSLLDHGFSLTPQILSPQACRTLIASYEIESNFRAKISMEQFNFGKGEYKYFTYPLPISVQNLREAFYARLVDAANIWCERLAIRRRYPPTVAELR